MQASNISYRQPIDIVKQFISCWNQRDFDTLMELLTEDIEYHNIPMPMLNGKAAVRDFIAPFEYVSAIDWVLHHVASNQQVVMTERTDTFIFANGKALSLPVMGTFEVRGQLICKWRDYFDLLDFQRQMQAVED
ncbi:MAG: nuclear transport factor 2 family protein [Porticoccaceae bacterium]|nr:nuclear transport factor 2 family protein [Porticoccaceae bacterium]